MSGYKSRYHQLLAWVRESRRTGKPLGLRVLRDAYDLGVFDQNHRHVKNQTKTRKREGKG